MIIAEARRCQCPHATANIFPLPTAIVPSVSVPATAPVAGLSTAPTVVLPTTIASVAALGGDNATSPAQARSRLYRPPLCVGSRALYALGQQTQARNTSPVLYWVSFCAPRPFTPFPPTQLHRQKRQ